MAHVFAARAVVPGMIKRGGGYLVNVASGASLLCQMGDAAYSTTKTAALGFAESLAITMVMTILKSLWFALFMLRQP